MNLGELNQGESGVIQKVRGRGAFRKRIMEMGFVAGKNVEVIKRAPLRDPIEYSIMGYQISLRKEEADLIELMPVNETIENINVYYGTTQDANERKPISLQRKNITVAFVGNPNCGKTTIFNQVSGLHEKVGNYSGVTVEAKQAKFKYKEYVFNIIDLPGAYSINTFSPEELYVRQHIIDEVPDVIINVVDGSNLERNLYLTTQLIDLDVRIVAALNMYDELEKSGNKLNVEMLSTLLGIPFIPTVGSKNVGISDLFDAVIMVFEDRHPQMRHIHINYGIDIESAISQVQRKIKISKNSSITNLISSRFLSIKLLENDLDAQSRIQKCINFDEIMDEATKQVKTLQAEFKENTETILTDAKYGFIDGALKETMLVSTIIDKRSRTRLIDDFITDKLYSFPIFIFLMWLMFQATFYLGSFPQDWIEKMVNLLSAELSILIPNGILKDLFIDGIIGGVGGVIVFLPNILILFFFISLMEDSGYMARVAFIVDKLMHKVGLHGRSFIPMLMGFGCNVPAIMATRTIEGRNDRLVTMLINPFMSCSARLPVYVLIISAFFPSHPGSMLFLVYSIGIAMAGIIAWIFKKTLFKAKELPFVMELPPYRMPSVNSLFKHMWFRAGMYLKKMASVILIASLVIWALNYFPRNVEYSRNYDDLKSSLEVKSSSIIQNQEISFAIDSLNRMQNLERLEKSYIGQIGKAIEPVMRPLGFDWKMGVSLLTGLAAKEIVVSTMGVLYQAESQHENQGLVQKLRTSTHSTGRHKGELVFTPLVAFGFLMFILFYFPCIAVVAAIRRESGEWKWAVFAVVYTTSLAWLVSFLLYQIGSLFS